MKSIPLDSDFFKAINEAEWVRRVIQSCETEEQYSHLGQLIELYIKKWGKVLDGVNLEGTTYWELTQLKIHQYNIIQEYLDKPQGPDIL